MEFNLETKENLFKEYKDILIFDELTEILKLGKNTAYDLLQTKEIYSKKIGKEYKIPKICVVDYLFKQVSDKNTILKSYQDVLDFQEVLEILRNPSENTVYKLLKDKEIYSIKIARGYKIPKVSLIDFLFKENI